MSAVDFRLAESFIRFFSCGGVNDPALHNITGGGGGGVDISAT